MDNHDDLNKDYGKQQKKVEAQGIASFLGPKRRGRKGVVSAVAHVEFHFCTLMMPNFDTKRTKRYTVHKFIEAT